MTSDPAPVHARSARTPAALALAACLLLTSCSTQQAPDRETAPNHPASGSATSAKDTADEVRGGLPAVPATHSPTALAHQLDRAVTTLQHHKATATGIRRAGEFQQLAVLTVATASTAFRRKVMARLRPATALVTRGDVRSARLLRAMTTPQRTLPRWRIVKPAPAAELLGYYRRAQRRTGVPWTYLAAIHLVETRMGRIRGASTAGALGPMQFLPSTWDMYGAGGDINDPRDAILAAARLLKAHGAPEHMAGALWHYNPSDYYVRAVTEHARAMQRSRSVYRGYWHWRVLYLHRRGTYVLPVGYPNTHPVLLRWLD